MNRLTVEERGNAKVAERASATDSSAILKDNSVRSERRESRGGTPAPGLP